MSKNNQPLTFYERQQIEYYLKLKLSKRSIGKKLKRNHSIVVKEIKRHWHLKLGYRADLAQSRANLMAKKTNKRKLDKDYWLLRYVEEQLETGLSPQQIAGRLTECPPPDLKGKTISHEAIYQYIYQTVCGRHLYRYLRRNRPKRQKQGRSQKHNKIHILDRVSIHERPEEINQKVRYGDWERDLVEFGKREEHLAVLYERKSMLVRLNKVFNKTAEESLRVIYQTINSLPPTLSKSMTFDNGTENAKHFQLKKERGIKTYFCDPYAAWQKGGVENANGLIRQYLPKRTDLSKLTNEDIHQIQEKLNNRPRKSLNYQTPNEIINREFGLRGGALNY